MENKELSEFEGLRQLITASYLDADPEPLTRDHFDGFVENMNKIHQGRMEGYIEWLRRKYGD